MALLNGSHGRQAASSFPTLFISLWLHNSFSSAEWFRVLLPQCSSNKLTDLTRLPELKPKFQFCVSVSTFRYLSQQLAAAIPVQRGPGLVATDGSLKALRPRLCSEGWPLPRLCEDRRVVACRGL